MKQFIKGEFRESKKLLVINLKNGEEKINPSIYKAYKEINIFPKSITNSIEKYRGLLKHFFTLNIFNILNLRNHIYDKIRYLFKK